MDGSQGPSDPSAGCGEAGTAAGPTAWPFVGASPFDSVFTGGGGGGRGIDFCLGGTVLGSLMASLVSCFSLEGPDGVKGRRFGNIGLLPLVRGAFRAYIGGSSYRVLFRFVEESGKEVGPGAAVFASALAGVMAIWSTEPEEATSFANGGFDGGEELYSGEAEGAAACDDFGVFGWWSY